MKNRKWLLAMMGVFAVLTAYGELPPSRAWWQKIGYNAYALYRSSDLIGEGYVEAVQELLTKRADGLGRLKLTVVFTNMIKGSPGKYVLDMPADMRWSRGATAIPSWWPVYTNELIRHPFGGVSFTVVFTNTIEGLSASALPYTNTATIYPPAAQMLDTNGMFCGKPGQSYALACEKKRDFMELHAILPPEVWATFSDQVAEGKRKHEEWVQAKKARRHEIEILQLKLKDALELEDITQEEYDRQSERLEPLKEESNEIYYEMWNDEAGYKYYDETLLKGGQ